MLDIRTLCQSRGVASFNPLEWRRQYIRSRESGAIADWLHNLASFAALEFHGFDESRFWHDYEWLFEYPAKSDYGRYRIGRYRQHFECALKGAAGHWA